ncbi:tRNA-specific adenosine deaminase 1 [Lucilia sericata]|uniref:tRNA-specific adenosine deaminase 1 n=1 Tax=Lucilia sericata TaxID=13632 RepID=UPI0018A82F2E|nr:tRNA-specific adenosine deaminase 1 [Lucilia sericata]
MSSESVAPSAEISAEEIAKLCFDKFRSLPKTGKPNEKEWTILAGVVLHHKQTAKSEVISLGSGTKCIGKSKLCPQGLILNDSHAEVMARRGLMRYMYHQLKNALLKSDGDESIFEWLPEQQKFQLKKDLTLHFLSTQTPCGDACIIAEAKPQDCNEEEPIIKRSKLEEVKFDETNTGCIVDSVYTGAKLIGSHHSDAMQQLVGAVRTKPGRGERTLSMSCSDKLAKWQVMGVQGTLLDFLILAPIYFDTLNFWGDNDFVSLERAIWKRFENNDFKSTKYKLHIPEIRICKKPEFLYAQDNAKQPSPNGLVWCNIPEVLKPYEISVNGKKQGITLKKLQSSQSALKISKFFLLKEFINVLKMQPALCNTVDKLESKTYFECKSLAKDYQNAWSTVKLNYFRQWSYKPDNLLHFSVEEVENKDNIKK